MIYIYNIIKGKIKNSRLINKSIIGKENINNKKIEQYISTNFEISECDILVQVENFTSGGLENIVLDLNEVLIDNGFKLVFLVLGYPGEGVNRAKNKGMNVIVTNYQLETYRLLIEKLEPKLILTHYSILGVELFKKLQIPYIQVLQNTYMWFSDDQKKEFAQAAHLTTAFIALSDFVKEYSIKILGVPREKIIVLPCGIDTAAFAASGSINKRTQLRNELGFNYNDFIFLSVGSINHQKNHISTVHSFAKISSLLPTAKLVIIGPVFEEYLLTEIMEFIEKNNLNDKIIYAGSIDGPQKFYTMADVFVSASFFEGGPLNFLEALCANLPIIITNVGLAQHFKRNLGIQIIEPPLNIFLYSGKLTELNSNIVFEEALGKSMLNAYKNSKRPDLPKPLLQLMDRKIAYQHYVEFITSIINNEDKQQNTNLNNWIDQI